MISTANLVVAIALSYLGARTGDKAHAEIISVFNQMKPHGYTARLNDPWCAIFWTVVQILSGNASCVPLSASCSQIIADAKALGMWVENESVTPKIGWGVLYDWQDSGVGDNKGAPDHIGICYAVDEKYIYVIEGNKGIGEVGKRAILINGRYLRGFVAPHYTPVKKATYRPTTKYKGKVPTSLVRYGSEGINAKRAQTFLNWAIGVKLKTDGKCGRLTTESIITYPATEGIKASGIFGKKTRAKARKLASTDPMKPWYDAQKKQYDWSKNQAYKWTTPTVKSSRVRGTCITFPAVSLQRLGLLPKGGYVFWDNGKLAGSVPFLKKHPETFEILYPKKVPSKAHLKKGDICCFSTHTMIYAGTDKKGRMRWNTMGKSKRGMNVIYPYFDSKRVMAIIRLKGVKL